MTSKLISKFNGVAGLLILPALIVAAVAFSMSTDTKTAEAHHFVQPVAESDNGNPLAECESLFPNESAIVAFKPAGDDNVNSASGPHSATSAVDTNLTIDYVLADDLVNGAGGPSNWMVSWNSTLPIDAVIMKGSDGGLGYVYTGGETSDVSVAPDGVIHTPTNRSGKWAGTSHVTFCYVRRLDVTKTVDSVDYTRDHNWDISKSVTPDSHDLFVGETGTSTYTVNVVEQAPTDYDFVVKGGITVSNPWSTAATGIVITDDLGVTPVTIDCDTGFTGSLALNESVDCQYASDPVASAAVLPSDNIATATAIDFGEVEATAAIVVGDPTTENDATVTVDDANDPSTPRGSFDTDASFSYDVTFGDCVRDETTGGYTGNATHTNVASLVGSTSGELATATADVSVACYEIAVAKTVDSTSFTRTTDWTISKSVVDETGDNDGAYNINAEQYLILNYTVDVAGTPTDSDHAVHGEITVSNPHPTRSITVDVVDNGVSFGQVTIPAASDSAPVAYSVDGDAAGGVNIASASYVGDTVASAPVPYSFGSAVVDLVDNSADVLDSQSIDGSASGTPINELVSAGADGAFAGSWSYVTTVGPYACGTDHAVDNTASAVAGSGNGDSATVNVVINVADCGGDGGYTLTPGYWKTHSMAHNDGRHYDDTWDEIGPLGEDELYFDPTYTWIEIMWVNDGGNAYVKLSRAYIAATLNALNGADTSAVDDELAWAADWLANNTADGIGSLKGKAKKAAQEAVEVAGTLDDYNNGIIGPGHGNF